MQHKMIGLVHILHGEPAWMLTATSRPRIRQIVRAQFEAANMAFK